MPIYIPFSFATDIVERTAVIQRLENLGFSQVIGRHGQQLFTLPQHCIFVVATNIQDMNIPKENQSYLYHLLEKHNAIIVDGETGKVLVAYSGDMRPIFFQPAPYSLSSSSSSSLSGNDSSVAPAASVISSESSLTVPVFTPSVTEIPLPMIMEEIEINGPNLPPDFLFGEKRIFTVPSSTVSSFVSAASSSVSTASFSVPTVAPLPVAEVKQEREGKPVEVEKRITQPKEKKSSFPDKAKKTEGWIKPSGETKKEEGSGKNSKPSPFFNFASYDPKLVKVVIPTVDVPTVSTALPSQEDKNDPEAFLRPCRL